MTGSSMGSRARTAVTVAIAAGFALTVSACGSSGTKAGSTSTAANGPVTISVGCEPPTTQAQPRADWLADVAAFEKLNPNITVKGDDTNPCDDPATFNAKLASGKMDDVFYTYFTDGANVVASGQAADIQSYVKQIANEGSILPQLLNVYRQGDSSSGDLYGIPVNNYTEGLVYNTTLFQRARSEEHTSELQSPC